MSPNVFKQMDDQIKYRDCAELFRAGFNRSGIYTIYISTQDMHKVSLNGVWNHSYSSQASSVEFVMCYVYLYWTFI